MTKETKSGEQETDIGLSMVDVMNLPDEEQKLVNWIMRHKSVSLAEVVAHTGAGEDIALAQLDTLIAQGFVQEVEQGSDRYYRPRLTSKRRSKLSTDIWQSLDEKAPGEE